jgi:glutamyl-tRNA reductase
MQIVCLGISHKTAPIEVRERFAVLESHLAETTQTIRQLPGVEEAVVVSTCNRVEY